MKISLSKNLLRDVVFHTGALINFVIMTVLILTVIGEVFLIDIPSQGSFGSVLFLVYFAGGIFSVVILALLHIILEVLVYRLLFNLNLSKVLLPVLIIKIIAYLLVSPIIVIIALMLMH